MPARSVPLARAALVLGLVSLTGAAQAKEGELQLGGAAGIGIPESSTVGPAGMAVVSYGLLDWLDVEAGVSFSALHSEPSGGSQALLSPRVGPSFKLDVWEIVPFVAANVGLYSYLGGAELPDPEPPSPSAPSLSGTFFGVSGAWGADYLLSRQISLLARIEHNLLFTSPNVTGYHLVLLGARYHFDL